MNKQMIVLIGRCAAGKSAVQKRLAEAGVDAVDLSLNGLKTLLANKSKNVDIFVVWVKAPLQLRINRFLEQEGDTLESRYKLVDQLLADGKDFNGQLNDELNEYIYTKRIKYWLTIYNSETNLYRLDFIVDYLTEMLKEFQ